MLHTHPYFDNGLDTFGKLSATGQYIVDSWTIGQDTSNSVTKYFKKAGRGCREDT
jgi:hypothetical protein